MITVNLTHEHIDEAPRGSRFSPVELAISDALLIPTGRVKVNPGCACVLPYVFVSDPGRNSGAERSIDEAAAKAHLAWQRGETIEPMRFEIGDPKAPAREAQRA